MRLFDLKLRYWSFLQLLVDRAEQPKDSEDAGDFARSRREFFVDAVLMGRVTERCFAVIDDQFPEIRSAEVLADDEAVLRIADAQLARYASMGEERSGYRVGFLLAQREHLRGCARCRKRVAAAVREDVRTAVSINRMFRDLGPDARRRVVEDFVPERLRRRRGDQTLN